MTTNKMYFHLISYGTPASSEVGVGSESSNYIHLFMAYDTESSQAANHALALIGSSESLFKTDSQENDDTSDEGIAKRYISSITQRKFLFSPKRNLLFSHFGKICRFLTWIIC